MKDYSLFNYQYLFGDWQKKVSEQAILLYIKMNFCATNGFVANVNEILDGMGYDKGVLQELINAEEVLTLPNRTEVFITSFFVHNKGANKFSWMQTPYGIYWKGKLWMKENGIATLKKQELNKQPSQEQTSLKMTENEQIIHNESWDEILADIEHSKLAS